MPEKPNAVIIYGNKDTRDNYKNLIGGLEAMNINVLPLDMDWSVDYHNPDKYGPRYWAQQVKEQVGDKPVNILIGHSFGALTIFPYASDLIASGKPPEQIIFLSRSPYAAEDLEDNRKNRKAVKKYKRTIFRDGGVIPAGLLAVKISPLAETISKKIESDRVRVLVGEKESRRMKKAAKRTAELFGIAKPIVVKKSAHDVDQYPLYIARTLQEVRGSL